MEPSAHSGSENGFGAMLRNSVRCAFFCLVTFLWIRATVDAGPFFKSGELVVLSGELLKAERRMVSGVGYPYPGDLRLAIAVPEGFDAAKVYPILFVSVTGSKYRTNIEEMESYREVATKLGWVVMTAEGERWPRRRHDTISFRRTYMRAGFRLLNETLPASSEWPVVFGGFSGGAKLSQYLAVDSLKRGLPVAGIWAGGCNESHLAEALSQSRLDSGSLSELRVFLCNGNADTVSRLSQAEKVAEEMETLGVDLELFEYEGGHVPSDAALRRGLEFLRADLPQFGTL